MKVALPVLLALALGSARADCVVRVETVNGEGNPIPGVKVWLVSNETRYESPRRYSDTLGIVSFTQVPEHSSFTTYGAFPGSVVLPVAGSCSCAEKPVTLSIIQPLTMSLVKLLATPGLFDGRYIGVTGVLQVEFEGDALYLDAASLKNNVTKNAIWLDLPLDQRAALRTRVNQYTGLVGRFNAKRLGHTNLFSGALKTCV
jgi:hypothetical protein